MARLGGVLQVVLALWSRLGGRMGPFRTNLAGLGGVLGSPGSFGDPPPHQNGGPGLAGEGVQGEGETQKPHTPWHPLSRGSADPGGHGETAN